MKLRNVFTVLGTAAVTTAVTLGLADLWAGGRAEAGPAAVKPVIARPELTTPDCLFSLKADKTTYEAGETPVFEVTAINTRKQDVKVSVWINVSAVAPTSPMSRMLPRPRSLWSEEVTFSLEPGETKTKKVTCGAALPAGQSVSVTLSDKKETIMPLNVPVTNAANTAQPGGPNQAGGPNFVPPNRQQ
jgi:hypothetical protein